MASAKNVAGGPEINGEGVDLARREERGGFLRIAIFRAEDSFGDVDGRTVGRHIDELGGEVGVHRGGGGKEFEAHGAGNFEVMFEWRRGIDENVVALFQSTLVFRAGCKMDGIATERATGGGHGLAGIEGKLVRGFGGGR